MVVGQRRRERSKGEKVRKKGEGRERETPNPLYIGVLSFVLFC